MTDDLMDGETVLVAHDHDESPAIRVAHAAWSAECERVEGLRLKYAPDEAPWQPAAPNTPPIARPSWLAKVLAAESKIRDRELAAAEAEQIRRSKRDVTRGEFEDLLTLLGVTISQSADVARHAAWRAHMDKINAPHPSDFSLPPEQEAERQRVMRERAQRDYDHMAAVNRGEHLK